MNKFQVLRIACGEPVREYQLEQLQGSLFKLIMVDSVRHKPRLLIQNGAHMSDSESRRNASGRVLDGGRGRQIDESRRMGPWNWRGMYRHLLGVGVKRIEAVDLHLLNEAI